MHQPIFPPFSLLIIGDEHQPPFPPFSRLIIGDEDHIFPLVDYFFTVNKTK